MNMLNHSNPLNNKKNKENNKVKNPPQGPRGISPKPPNNTEGNANSGKC
jgi:hypothetical protein